MEFAGADAYLGTETIAETVREAGGAVAIDSCGVDHLHEAGGHGIITGQNGVCVVGTVAVDVVNGFLDIRDDFDGDDHIQVLRAEIVVCHDIDSFDLCGSLRGARDQVFCLLCASEFYAGVLEFAGQAGKEDRGDLPVDQESLHGVAGSCVLGLGVKDDVCGHVHIDIAVQVDVADAVRVSHDGNLCIVHDVLHELVGAAGNEQVHIFFALQKLVDLIVELSLQQAGFGKACRDSGFVDDGKEDAVCFCGLFTALQDRAVAALEAEGGNLYQSIRPRLENDTDHADGDTDTLEDKPGVQLPFQEGFSDRIGKGDQLVNAFTDIVELCVIKDETLHDCLCDAVLSGGLAVLSVCGKDFVFSCRQGFCDRAQGTISHFVGRCGKHRSDKLHFPRFFTDIHHIPPCTG